MLELASVQSLTAMTGDEFDRDPWMLAVSNGVIDLRDGSFRAGRPEDCLSLQGVAAFERNATCSRWLQFIEEVFDQNVGLAAFVQRVTGYCLTGLTREQVVFCLHGNGENGKGTLVETLTKAVFGAYAGVLPFASLLHGRDGHAVPDDLASIVGTRMVVASEPRESGRLDEDRIKSFSGEDTLKARHLYGRWFEFTPTFKLWLQFNDRPRVTDSSHGLWRRILLIPFHRRFSDKERDNQLKAKLAAEAAGILNWAIRGCLMWQRDGLNPPDEVRAAVDEWRVEEDLIAEFVTFGCEPSPGTWCSTAELFVAFGRWCESQGVPPKDRVRRRTFTSRLSTMIKGARRREGNGFIGLRPTTEVTKLSSTAPIPVNLPARAHVREFTKGASPNVT